MRWMVIFVTAMLAWILTILLTYFMGVARGLIGLLLQALLLAIPFITLLLVIYPRKPQGELHTRPWLVAGALILAGLLLPTFWLTTGELEPLSQGLEILLSILVFLMPFLAVIAAMLLLYIGLVLLRPPKQTAEAPGETVTQPGWHAWAALGLSAALLIKLGHNLYNLFLWDATVDSLGILWLAPWLLAAIFCGLALALRLAGWQKLAGVAFAILVPLYLYAVFRSASQVDYRRLTEQRAARLQEAIEAYQQRTGGYPSVLNQLTPRQMLSVPPPVIIPGQDWCYDGTAEYYRLGYITRQHWSDPNVYEQLYASSAGAPEEPGVCHWQLRNLIDFGEGFYQESDDGG